MKLTIFSVLAMSLFTSSVWADSQKEPNAITLTGVSGDLNCETKFTVDGYFYANSDTENFSYGLWFGEATDSKDAILTHEYMPQAIGSGVSTVADFFGSGKNAFKMPFHFEGALGDMISSNDYDDSGKILFDSSKEYYVYAYVIPGVVDNYSDGKFQIKSGSAVDNANVYTNIGGSFPPTDAGKFIKFDYKSCTNSQLPTSKEQVSTV